MGLEEIFDDHPVQTPQPRQGAEECVQVGLEYFQAGRLQGKAGYCRYANSPGQIYLSAFLMALHTDGIENWGFLEPAQSIWENSLKKCCFLPVWEQPRCKSAMDSFCFIRIMIPYLSAHSM